MTTVTAPPTSTTRVLTVRGITDADVEAWRDLAHRAAEPNVFFEPDFLLPTVAHFDPEGTVRLLVVDDGGRWTACLPFEMVPGDRHWPRRHATNDGPVLNRVTSLGSPLLDGADADAAAGALVAALRRHGRELGRAFAFAYVAEDGAAGGALHRALDAAGLAVHRWGDDERAAVRFDALPDSEDPLGHVPRSRARSVRRRARRLGEELGAPVALPGVSLVAVDDPEAFLAFEHETWKAEDHGVGFSRTEGGEAWFAEVFAAYGASGNATILALAVAGVTLYMAGFLRSGSTVFAWYDEYASRWARYAPGVVGRVLSVRYFADDPRSALLDSCMHPSLYPDQNELYPARRRIVSFTTALGPAPYGWLLRAIPRVGAARRALERRRAGSSPTPADTEESPT